MRDREESVGVLGESSLFVGQVQYSHGEDRSVRCGGFAEAPEIGLAERALPRERLAGDAPAPVAVPLALGHLGQRRASRATSSTVTMTAG